MKRLVISVLLAAISAGLGYYGIHDWNGESGGHWVVLLGITFIVPALWTRSWIFGGLIHTAVCFATVFGISRVYYWVLESTEFSVTSSLIFRNNT